MYSNIYIYIIDKDAHISPWLPGREEQAKRNEEQEATGGDCVAERAHTGGHLYIRSLSLLYIYIYNFSSYSETHTYIYLYIHRYIYIYNMHV